MALAWGQRNQDSTSPFDQELISNKWRHQTHLVDGLPTPSMESGYIVLKTSVTNTDDVKRISSLLFLLSKFR